MSGTDSKDAMSEGKLFGMMAVQLGLFVAGGIGLWLFSGRSLADFVKLDAAGLLLGVAVGGLLIGVMATLWKVFPATGERLIRLQAPTYLEFGRPSPALIVFLSVAAGAGEEALFRGGLQTLLGDYMPIAAAIALAAAVFAIVHFAAPVVMALIFAIGTLFGVVYDLTGSLLAVMLAHTIYDIWALRFVFTEFDRLGLYDEPPPA